MIWTDQYGRTSVEVLVQFEQEMRVRRRAARARDNLKYQRTDAGREMVSASVLRSQAKYPDKAAARAELRSAIKKGLLSRPNVCSIQLPLNSCHRGRIEAHHPDYSRPLGVIWCCHRCHRVLG